jgi:hypothetical protein
MMHRSDDPWERPNTSRMPSGEVTATIGGTSHFGPNLIRVTGPPASRISSCPVLRLRTNFTNCRSGSGFFGANGSVPTSVIATISMRIAPHESSRKRGAPQGAPRSDD